MHELFFGLLMARSCPIQRTVLLDGELTRQVPGLPMLQLGRHLQQIVPDDVQDPAGSRVSNK